MSSSAEKTVLIPGAASGIGRAAAQRFAAAGWRCVLVDRNGEALDRLVSSLPAAGGAVHLVRVADLMQPDQIAALAVGVPALDAIINNAGMSLQLDVIGDAARRWAGMGCDIGGKTYRATLDASVLGARRGTGQSPCRRARGSGALRA
ncbi:SDR family NAD(P)-dependent oxidoreductase [Paraburkholderia sp. CNPSo 3281]|uniref:SDR family NAD(P)-dependent oxidoreductase n=1 Tax=Paraburkholderia sp. CNPSo 3281 TaxID=2940933 RepID=UPI0020B67ECE|nr:SDR family NAD(P)-dependent oxidoreductase [Paraburkholderia sp. CNPSo 3281]MCP3721110.1 SDR family oxidoreductase [Paraburkholderia sp. CNPSo 3281]